MMSHPIQYCAKVLGFLNVYIRIHHAEPSERHLIKDAAQTDSRIHQIKIFSEEEEVLQQMVQCHDLSPSGII